MEKDSEQTVAGVRHGVKQEWVVVLVTESPGTPHPHQEIHN